MRERQTRQLSAIREVMCKEARPMSPQEVLDAARTIVPSISVASIYRILKHLIEDGWLVMHEIPGGGTRYERSGLGHHHHFHCNRCDRVFDIRGCVGNVSKLLPKGFSLEDHDLLLRGNCASCRLSLSPLSLS